MNNKENYVQVEMEIINLNIEDIIITSCTDDTDIDTDL